MPALPSQAQLVIIGGGVGGCSIAYHLTQMGWTDVVVLERSELTSGSTFHSAGLVGQLRSDVNLTKLIRYSTDLYRRLKSETGHDPGWREVGSLRLASSPQRMEELRRQVGLARSFGLPLELISPAEAYELFPLMDPQGVQGAVFLPTDGFIDPTGLTMGLAAGAKSRGARLFTSTRVTGIQAAGGQVDRVLTDQGEIRTEVVVNAAGQWAGEIAAMVGVSLPVIPMAHLYMITRPIQGVRPDFPTMRDPDLLVYFREEVGGLVAGGYEREPAPWGLDGIPADFNNKLLPPDWDRFTPLMENAIRRVPALETAEVVQLINGPEGFTPDGEYLLGPTPVRGFWVAAAFCAHGLAGAGGLGKVMAEWIIHGHTEWDVWRLDLRRFGSNYTSQPYALARTVETYSKYYDIHYPHEERQSARDLRRSPAYPQLKELGAAFGEKTGWERPNWFTPYEALAQHGHVPGGWARHHWSPAIGYEHLATRERAALFDETSFSKLDVRGPGALAALQYLCANDLDRPIDTVVYTSMLNPRGGIECDFTVTRLGPDHFRIVTGTAFGQHDLSWIRLNMPSPDSLWVEDVTGSLACFGLWGPRARTILQRLTRQDLSNTAFPYMTARRMTVGEVPVLALRVTYVGELGWELYCSMEYGHRLWGILWEAGRPDGLVAGGYRAIDTLRLEKGYRYWSAEISPDYTPFEAGLGFAVKLDKGEFIGREALLRQKQQGLQQKLCCLALASDSTIALGNEPVRLAGAEPVVGWVTSGGYGYSVRKSIAYSYLPMEHSAPGTRLEVELMGERVPAEVVREPLWDPRGERIRA
jgi:4-methylaminobutanoate oxidase (formaldehyde-forming)